MGRKAMKGGYGKRLGVSQQAILDLHKQGQLLMHMFEMPIREAISDKNRQDSLANFFAVMAGGKGASYSNHYHSNIVSGEEGYPALATSLLFAGKPIPAFTDQSQVGLLLDASDTAHVKPLFVNSKDTWSYVKDDQVEVAKPDHGELGKQLARIQVPKATSCKFSFSRDKERYWANATKAFEVMRNAFKTQLWEELYPSSLLARDMNEVLATVHLKAVKAIVVSRTFAQGLPTSLVPVAAVSEAVKVRNWLRDHYPKEFPEPLPIVYYDPGRSESQLRFLSPQELRNPWSLAMSNQNTKC